MHRVDVFGFAQEEHGCKLGMLLAATGAVGKKDNWSDQGKTDRSTQLGKTDLFRKDLPNVCLGVLLNDERGSTRIICRPMSRSLFATQSLNDRT